ncbi:cupin [Patescibacteria group bacterium]|nr:cupin [Patescibacteria group bacterium]MBU1500838.1 cupin [Patescibacteria group bacterium]MBU2080893.1 cupin [Patescibacteria group bacterium]MBU2123998.1 cupin [Patescibacteria group bacterium]MBU2194711.1 cupin [Patescibacteria group bacterium]
MSYKLLKANVLPVKQKHEMTIVTLPHIGNCDVITAQTETGHNQEFYDKESTFHYIIVSGGGSFFLDDQEVQVQKGDYLSVAPKTRIYYKGKMELVLITNPPWKEENEVETRSVLW